ncbi:bifunctional 3-(3-hydroxy-phenyl)propionate/3-hydroxycinnamic acid hydroxylase [Patulibacter sp. NPDC049589]|uniref:bifunctional 3-(3-hydroxy-phenyl)propionate/3-hydroxycinnamic acid hydroxylase n=1 Tax=Patulibacter sp. NPDC049589 TaxID=3154731 RepID=UPI0034240BC9
MGTADNHYDVVVVGYGLAGEAAASLLARLGHKVVVFERWPSLYGLPRTISTDGEGSRIIDKAGDVEHALEGSSKIRSYEIVDADHNRIVGRTWDDENVCGFYNRTSFYQPNVEEAMDRGARTHGAEINQGWEVTSIVQDDDGVTVEVVEHEGVGEAPIVDPQRRTVTASYVIGADGARSSVRAGVPTDWTYYDYRDAWLSVDVRRKHALERFDPSASLQIISPERVVASIPIGQERIRFEFLLGGEPEEHQDLTEEAGYRFLEEAFGVTRADVEIYRQVVYPFEGRMAQQWRHGRIFLAGDAAHLMPPFVGMGAVSAFRDAINLAWKLDLVIRGISGDGLLDTYQQERWPHVESYIQLGVAIGKMCAITDPAAAEARNEAMRDGGSEQPPDPEYDLGVLQMEDGVVARPAGLREPQGVVRRGAEEGRFDDVVGPWGFSLVVRDADATALLSDEQRAFLGTIGCKIVELSRDAGSKAWIEQDDDYEKYFSEHGIIGYLSRPDFRLFAGIRALDDLPGIVDDLREQLALTPVASAA